jgi:hypothetical protein
LAEFVTNEQVEIQEYRAGLQYKLCELCRTSAAGTRSATLHEIVQYATLQLPVIHEHIAKKKKQSSGDSTKVVKKRKASGGGASRFGRSSSKARFGASGTLLSDEQKKKDLEQRLNHRCHKPGYQIKQCPLNKSKGKVAVASGSALQDDMSEEEFLCL